MNETRHHTTEPTPRVASSRRRVLGRLAVAAVGGIAAAGGIGRAFAQPAAVAPRRPFPQHRTYSAGTIRPNHRTQAQLDEDVRLAYNRWKQRYLVLVPGAPQRYRIAKGKPGTALHDQTVSEGQGYGMVIVAHLAGHDPAARTIFDGLHRFVRSHPSEIDGRMMDWDANPGTGGNSSAFDGDSDIAYGLLLAHAQWGSTGPINYLAEARRVLGGLLGSTIGPNSHLPLLGDWVTVTEDPRYTEWATRTSDFMPGHFRAFGRTTAPAAWAQVVGAVQGVVTTLQADHSPGTGLLPDFVQPVSATDHTPRPASPNFLERPVDGKYYYNAGRDPWRLGTDALLNRDAVSMRQVRKISTWAKAATGGDPQRIRAGYHLNGAPLPDSAFFSTFFAAPLGVAAMTLPTQQAWLNAIYDDVRTVDQDYYEDTVTLLCLLVMTRTFWDPTVA